MEAIAKPQIRLIKTVCRKKRIDSGFMAAIYSNDRTEHVSDLTKDEAKQLIESLLNDNKENKFSPKQMMIRKILSMAHELRWETVETRKGKSNKIDMERVNNWCIQYGYLHKELDRYTESELPKLITQFSKHHESVLERL